MTAAVVPNTVNREMVPEGDVVIGGDSLRRTDALSWGRVTPGVRRRRAGCYKRVGRECAVSQRRAGRTAVRLPPESALTPKSSAPDTVPA